MVRMDWNIDGPPSTWVKQLMALPWVTPKIQKWIQLRVTLFGQPTTGESLADNTTALWQLIPGSAQGYFDGASIVALAYSRTRTREQRDRN